MAQHRSIWPALLLLGAIAVLIYAATSIGWQGRAPSWQPVASPATQERGKIQAPVGSRRAPGGAARASVCVTRFTLCTTVPARAGDPCSCPHPIRGLVPGHVENVGGELRRPNARHWPDRQDPRDIYDWDALVAP